MDDRSMRQVAFAPKLDWSYQPPEGSTDKDCGKYSYEDIMTKKLGDLARCIYLRNDSSTAVPSPSENIFTIRRACNPLTVERLPVCFYCIIKVIRAYPDAPELELVTKEMLNTSLVSGNFKFKDTPPALAYLLLDAMRSAFGEYSGSKYSASGTGSSFARWCLTRTRVMKGSPLKTVTRLRMNTLSSIGNGWQHAGSRRMVLRCNT